MKPALFHSVPNHSDLHQHSLFPRLSKMQNRIQMLSTNHYTEELWYETISYFFQNSSLAVGIFSSVGLTSR